MGVAALLSKHEANQLLFDLTPHPLWLVDEESNVSPINPSAALVSAAHRAAEAVGATRQPVTGSVAAPGSVIGLLALIREAVTSRETVPCWVVGPDGRRTEAALFAVEVVCGAHRYTVAGLTQRAHLPDWALRDPVTGLGNRHLWEHEAADRSSCSGCVVFFDLDDLKEVNDLHGHFAGDRTLAAVGHALAALAPPDALIVRYGGDEFVAALSTDDPAVAERWAQDTVRHVAACGPTARLPIVPRLSHGLAVFGPGGLRDAVQRADDARYARKGVLLPAASGGRIILTREGRSALRGAGDDRVQPRSDIFSAGFGPEFDGYYRSAYARAIEQAQRFIEWVAPGVGEAVVEVGAGAGRVTFDGGLAERVGPTGQLLVTEPSGAQIQGARRKAAALGLHWVRFLRAPAEELPLASNTADLVLGSTFLHFTDAVCALREMARVIRPGGRLAVSNPIAFTWPPVWLEILEPVRAELARHGLPWRHFLPTADVLQQHVEESGVEITQCRKVGPDDMDFPSVDIACAFWRQTTIVALMLRGVPSGRYAEVQDAFDSRLRARFDQAAVEERRLRGEWLEIVARKPE